MKRRVLVIDDNEQDCIIIRCVIERVFHRDEIEVRVCGNAEDAALVLKRQEPFDLLIVDAHLTHESGPDFVQSMRSLGKLPEATQVMFVSAEPDYALHLMQRSGCTRDAFTRKPLEILELQGILLVMFNQP